MNLKPDAPPLTDQTGRYLAGFYKGVYINYQLPKDNANGRIYSKIFIIAFLVESILLHEVAHSYVALLFEDQPAKRQGRTENTFFLIGFLGQNPGTRRQVNKTASTRKAQIFPEGLRRQQPRFNRC